MRWSIEPGEAYFKYTELRNLELSSANSFFTENGSMSFTDYTYIYVYIYIYIRV